MSLDAPAEGCTARFGALTCAGVAGLAQTCGIRIHVSPDKKPFEVVDPIGRLEGAREILHGGHAQARQQCPATRLDIARGELGRYSPGPCAGVNASRAAAGQPARELDPAATSCTSSAVACRGVTRSP